MAIKIGFSKFDPLPYSEEFCKLAEEAEGELKEMEDILSLLPPPPPSPPVPTAAPAQGKEEAVDRSIECVLGEMAEIEGNCC